MTAREHYPAGVPCWVDTSQPDPDAAAAFYRELFGWEFEDRIPSAAPGRYLVATLNGLEVAAVGSQTEESPPPATVWSTYVAVADADKSTATVREAGGSVLLAPVDVPDAGRMAVCSDPSGAVFSLWQARGNTGAQLVNAPGSWNWSDLSTTDPDAATAFYGAVFGWQARPVDFGSDVATMLCLPGYGDYLASIDPELRERHGGDGVPEGFSDAIGWMAAITADSPLSEGLSHWSVTFAVEDTDDAAERAEKLDGRIVIAPYDAGPARIAVLEDPQGATFTVSRYQPG